MARAAPYAHVHVSGPVKDPLPIGIRRLGVRASSFVGSRPLAARRAL
jgi:hypothetical protein